MRQLIFCVWFVPLLTTSTGPLYLLPIKYHIYNLICRFVSSVDFDLTVCSLRSRSTIFIALLLFRTKLFAYKIVCHNDHWHLVKKSKKQNSMEQIFVTFSTVFSDNCVNLRFTFVARFFSTVSEWWFLTFFILIKWWILVNSNCHFSLL